MSGVLSNIKNEIAMSWMIAGGVALSVIFLSGPATNLMNSVPVLGGLSEISKVGIWAGVSAMGADYIVRIVNSA